MDEVTELCDRVLVLKKGVIIADNSPEQLAQSTSKVRVHLTITNGLESALSYLREAQLTHAIEDQHLTVELDEHAIAQISNAIGGAQHVIYSHISIDKPTLEDYFLSMVTKIKGLICIPLTHSTHFSFHVVQ